MPITDSVNKTVGGGKQKNKTKISHSVGTFPPKSKIALLAKQQCHQEANYKKQQQKNLIITLYSLNRYNNYNSFPSKTKCHKILMYVSTTLFFIVLNENPHS